MNTAVDNNTPQDLSDGFPDFHFLNIKDEYEANTNLEEDNPDAKIEALLFGDDDTTIKCEEGSAEDSLANDCNHDILLVHHALLQKGSINPD